jgi:hypothetical protein
MFIKTKGKSRGKELELTQKSQKQKGGISAKHKGFHLKKNNDKKKGLLPLN